MSAKEPDRNGTPPEALKNEKFISKQRRMVEQLVGRQVELGLPSDPARDKYPSLWYWLTNKDAGARHVKAPSSIKIIIGPTGCLMTLYDSDTTYNLEVKTPHLEDLFLAMEMELQSDSPGWKMSSRKDPKLRKRKTEN